MAGEFVPGGSNNGVKSIMRKGLLYSVAGVLFFVAGAIAISSNNPGGATAFFGVGVMNICLGIAARNKSVRPPSDS